jgi:N-acetylglucosaminyldiphosphoundecaprenol N-acetyl-beta-D-mannosaminyltransferase
MTATDLDTPTTGLCDFPIVAASYEENLKTIETAADRSPCTWVVTLNTEMISKTRQEPDYGEIIRSADMIVADGMPLVWASRIKRNCRRIPGRTTGVDIVASVLSGASALPFAIIGGRDPAATVSLHPNAAKRCRFIFNGRVTGSESEGMDLAKKLMTSGASIIFIALGVPKQDKLAMLLRKHLAGGVLIGVGGSFEILSGTGRRAPPWMQHAGLEWLFRLTREPGRLWKRYLLNYPRGLLALGKDCMGF